MMMSNYCFCLNHVPTPSTTSLKLKLKLFPQSHHLMIKKMGMGMGSSLLRPISMAMGKSDQPTDDLNLLKDFFDKKTLSKTFKDLLVTLAVESYNAVIVKDVQDAYPNLSTKLIFKCFKNKNFFLGITLFSALVGFGMFLEYCQSKKQK